MPPRQRHQLLLLTCILVCLKHEGISSPQWLLLPPEGRSGAPHGPYSDLQLRHWATEGRLPPDAKVRNTSGGPLYSLSDIVGRSADSRSGAWDDDSEDDRLGPHTTTSQSRLGGDDTSEEDEDILSRIAKQGQRPQEVFEGGRLSGSVSALKGSVGRIFGFGGSKARRGPPPRPSQYAQQSTRRPEQVRYQEGPAREYKPPPPPPPPPSSYNTGTGDYGHTQFDDLPPPPPPPPPPDDGMRREEQYPQGVRPRPQSKTGFNPKDVEEFLRANRDEGDRNDDQILSALNQGIHNEEEDLQHQRRMNMGREMGEVGSVRGEKRRQAASDLWETVPKETTRLRSVARGAVSVAGIPFVPFRVVASGLSTLSRGSGGPVSGLIWVVATLLDGLLPVSLLYFILQFIEQVCRYEAALYIGTAEYMNHVLRGVMTYFYMVLGVTMCRALLRGAVEGVKRRALRLSTAANYKALSALEVGKGEDTRPTPAAYGDLARAPYDYIDCWMKALKALITSVGAANMLMLLPIVNKKSVLYIGGGFAVVLLLEMLMVACTRGDDPRLVTIAESAVDGKANVLESAAARLELSLREVPLAALMKRQTAVTRQRIAGGIGFWSTLRGLIWWATISAGCGWILRSIILERSEQALKLHPLSLGFAQILLMHAALLSCLRSLRGAAAAKALCFRMVELSKRAGGAVISTAAAAPWDWQGWETEGPEPSIGVRFDDVSVSYPKRSECALKGVSFTIPSGYVVAIVGGEGSGKTTIVRTLLGLTDVQHGGLSFQGRPLSQWNSKAYRRRLAWISQDSVKLPLTTGLNIGVGDVVNLFDKSKWAQAAALSGVTQTIEQLPLSYDSVLSEGLQPGMLGSSGLSEGEWKRLLLARFMTRLNSPSVRMFVLDEPFGPGLIGGVTLMELLRARVAGTSCSAVLLSSRLNIGRMCDLVIYMEHGRVIEVGPPGQLLASNGAYAGALRLELAESK